MWTILTPPPTITELVQQLLSNVHKSKNHQHFTPILWTIKLCILHIETWKCNSKLCHNKKRNIITSSEAEKKKSLFLLFVSIALFHIQTMYEKKSTLRNPTIVYERKMKRYCHLCTATRTIPLYFSLFLCVFCFLLLFFRSILPPAACTSLPLFLCRATRVGCLCCRQPVSSALARPNISSGVFFLPLNTGVLWELSLDRSNVLWQPLTGLVALLLFIQ